MQYLLHLITVPYVPCLQYYIDSIAYIALQYFIALDSSEHMGVGSVHVWTIRADQDDR